jgi:hypothetical protein
LQTLQVCRAGVGVVLRNVWGLVAFSSAMTLLVPSVLTTSHVVFPVAALKNVDLPVPDHKSIVRQFADVRKTNRPAVRLISNAPEPLDG